MRGLRSRQGPKKARWTGSAARARIQVFPLAADREQLQSFCNRWFNERLPPQVSIFQPTMPIVYCTVLTYEDMGDQFRLYTGVLAQNEIYFLIIMDRFQVVGDQLRFIEHCVTTPYIFVDSAESVSFGRDRFGFPKEVCTFSEGGAINPVPWASDAENYLTVRTWQPTQTGRQLQPLLTIKRTPAFYDSGFDAQIGPRTRVRPRFGNRSDQLWWLQAALGEARSRAHPDYLRALPSMASSLGKLVAEGITISCFNVRQVPTVNNVSRVLYQDLVNFRMKLRGVQNIRFFGERFAANSDFSVLIRRQDTTPITRRLGLRVAERQRLPGRIGAQVFDEVHSLAPFYTQADITLESSDRLAWRFGNQNWTTSRFEYAHRTRRKKPPRFDPYLGSSSAALLQDRSEPPVSDIKYLMLPARTEAVSRYIKRFVPERSGLNVEPIEASGWTPLRILFSRARARTPDEIEGVVWLGGRYASLSVPVRYVYEGTSHEALLLLYGFSDNPFSIQVSRAVYGGPTHQAWFDGASGDWFEATKAVSQRQVVDTTFLERRSTEARFEVHRWLDIISDRRGTEWSETTKQASKALSPEFSKQVARLLPMLVYGGIPDSSNPRQWVEHRMTLVTLRSEVIETPRPPDTVEKHWLRIRSTETYPIVEGLELLTMSNLDFDLPASQTFPPGRIDVVPVVSIAETAEVAELKNVKVLWSERGLSKRNARGIGLGLSPRRFDF